MDFSGRQEILKGHIETPAAAIAKTEAVTLEEVAAVARDIFQPEKLNLAIIGPYKDDGKFRKILNKFSF